MGGTQYVGQNQGGLCQVCGAPLEADAMFCIMCGAQVNQAPAMQPAPQLEAAVAQQPKKYAKTQRIVGPMPGSMTCVICGNPIEPGAQFCVVCGTPVATGIGTTDNPNMGFVGGGGASPSACPHCGYPLEPDAMYCISCGLKIGSPASAGGVALNDGGTQPVWDGHPYDQPYDQPYDVVSQQTGPVTPLPAPPATDNDDDASVLSSLVMLSAAEARTGCVKLVEIDKSTHESVEVNIPAGVNVTTKLDIPGYGVLDELSGRRGPLRLSFFII